MSAVASPVRYQNLIGGEWADSSSGETFPSINPTTGDTWSVLPESDEHDVERAVRAARQAFSDPRWRDLSQTRRGGLLRRLGDLVGEHADRLSEIETTDIGKLLRETRAQARSVPEWFYFFAGAADKLRGDVIPSTDTLIFNYTLREPVGVVAAIVPWNSPLQLVATKIAPALAAGNTVIVKPSEHASASIIELGRLVEEAGFPPGVVNIVAGHAEASRRLVEHPDVDHVSFTGSDAVGRSVGQAAIGHFATVTLELGGKSPQIVFDDADPEAASTGIIAGVFAAAGQTCVAGSRAFVHKGLYDEVVERVSKRAAGILIGDPLDAETELGPLAFSAQRDRVSGYVESAVGEGARLLIGGGPPESPTSGFFYAPTILTDVENSMTIAREEVFGPVLSFMQPFSNEDAVIAAANDTHFGLAAGVWTQNLARAHRVSRRLDAGTVWVNMYRAVSPVSPTGGFGASGMGKENGTEALLEYTRVKSVWVNTDTGAPPDPFRMRTPSDD